MWYNPWLGWTFGYDYDWDWFNWGFDWGLGLGFGAGFWYGGWWGPVAFRPPYAGWNFYHRGFYGPHSYIARNDYFHANNIYRDRQGVFNRNGSERVISDHNGNIFRRNGQGGWEQRQSGAWRPVNDQGQRQNLERQEQMHNRGMTRSQNFQMSRGSFGGFRGGGGGFRGGGGGFRGGGGRR
jgi:hypothetical protein